MDFFYVMAVQTSYCGQNVTYTLEGLVDGESMGTRRDAYNYVYKLAQDTYGGSGGRGGSPEITVLFFSLEPNELDGFDRAI